MTTQPDTTAHITHTVGYGGTADADCRLCGAHASSHSLWATDDTDAWAQAHAADCTPATVRQRARHLWDASRLIAEHAEADPEDGVDWDHPTVRRVVAALRLRLQDTANSLENAAHDAEKGTAR